MHSTLIRTTVLSPDVSAELLRADLVLWEQMSVDAMPAFLDGVVVDDRTNQRRYFSPKTK